jgi:hypothetical protein
MLEGNKFIIVAGLEVVEAMRAERKARCRWTGYGYDSESLCAVQRDESAKGILGAEIVVSNYGCSVRYDSGLQDFALLASSRLKQIDGTIEAAEAWCRDWVAKDPGRRYAWRRAPAD